MDLFVKIFKEILNENPELNTPDLEEYSKATFKKAAELEIEWGKQIVGNKFEGITMDELEDYIKFYANIRHSQLGFKKHDIFPDAPRQNPLRWIKAYEDVDSGKTDFFEQKSRQYTKVNQENGFDDL